MVTYQCESCGGELELSKDNLSGKCRYCRSVFFFRAEKSEALTMALNRAGEMRRKCDFDGALTEYQVLLQQSPEDAEAHWGMVLSTYGIEYVEDPRTRVLTPTCRRTVMESILENAHYKKALACASAEQRPIYEQKAAVIDRLQKKIKRQLEEEEDYDVFISFKSTDENGYPTKDRLIARNLYDALTAKGIRTFYSEVTLADRIGEDYEPIIYKALYSSKCFILVATKEEYVNAVWVKNEWARYRDRITDEGLRGAAFAVFEGISPAALPPFLRTQGIDLAKYPAGGYAEQIADNLAKKWGIAPKEDSAEAKRLREELEQRINSMASSGAGGVSATNIINRANLFLEEQNWGEADKQAERALDVDARCAEAYLVKLLCELQLTGKDKLRGYAKPFDGSINYKRAVQFAGGELREYLTSCAEDAYKEEIYLAAKTLFDSARDETGYKAAAAEFAKIPGYKDADKKKAEAETAVLESIYQSATQQFNLAKGENGYKAAAAKFARIPGYKDAEEKKAEAETAALDVVYRRAEALFGKAKDEKEFKAVAAEFAKISGYKDADKKKAEAIVARKESVYLAAGELFANARDEKGYKSAATQFARIPGYKNADELHRKALETAAQTARRGKIQLLLLSSMFLITVVMNVVMSIIRGGVHWLPMILNAAALLALVFYFYKKYIYTKPITVFLCAATIAFSVFFTVYYTVDNGIHCYKYTETEDGVEITKANMYAAHTTEGVLEIPAEINGKKVVSIGESAFDGRANIVSVTIPNSVTSIGNSAFEGCSSLTSITIPDSVTSIGEGAFSGCSSLESMTLPFVGGNAKAKTGSNSNLFGFIFGTSSYTGGVATKQSYGSSTSSTTPTTYYIPATLRSVTITGGNILYGAFSNCSILTSVTIGDGVTSIGEGAFSGCSGLESMTLPFVGGSEKSATDTYQYPFGYIFGTSPYTGGVATKQYYYGSSTSSITFTTYYIPTTLRSVTITGGNILYGAFYNCSNLTGVAIGDGVTSIGSDAFRGCSSLTGITMPESVTSIGKMVFGGCSSLTSVTIGNGVTDIGLYAFRGCSTLTSITIPDSVTSIGDYAFSGCSSLTSVTYNGTKAQWNAISKGSGWSGNIKTVTCTDGTIQ